MGLTCNQKLVETGLIYRTEPLATSGQHNPTDVGRFDMLVSRPGALKLQVLENASMEKSSMG